MGLPTADRPTFDRRRCDIAAEVHRLSSPDERLRIRAASTIADAAATGAEDITDDVAAQRGVEALFPLLKSAATQPEALRAVAELAPAAPCQHAMIHVPGAIELLVDFLLSRNVGAQQHAARALANLAVNKASQVRIAELGGVAALVALLQKTTDYEVQLQCGGALHNLSFTEQNKMKIVAADGHIEMVSLLASQDLRCQVQAAAVIANLAFYPPNKHRIAEAGALEALVDLLLNSAVDEVKQECATAIARLATNQSSNAERAVHLGAVRPLVAMLESGLLDCRHFAQQALEAMGVDAAGIQAERDAAALRRKRAQGSADERAKLLIADGNEALLRGETGVAAKCFDDARNLQPSKEIAPVASARYTRAKRELTAHRCSIEALGSRALQLRNTRAARNATARSPLDDVERDAKLDGMLNIVALFRTIHKQGGVAAPYYLQSEFLAHRNKLDAADARLSHLQTLIHSKVTAQLHSQEENASHAADAVFDASGLHGKRLLGPELQDLVLQRDKSRAEYVLLGRAFVTATHGDNFKAHTEFAKHAVGPLQQAIDRLLAAQGLQHEDLDVSSMPADVAQHASEALILFEDWVGANTSVTVETRTEDALAQLLECTVQLLSPPATEVEVAAAPATGPKARQLLLDTTLPVSVDSAAAALEAEERFWDDASPLSSLPVRDILATAKKVLGGLRKQIADMGELQRTAELLESDGLPAAAVWVGLAPPTCEQLTELERLNADHREALETAMFEVTKLRNRPERLRDVNRIEQLESELPRLRKAVYDSSAAVSAERERLELLTREHFPELPKVYPEARLNSSKSQLENDSPVSQRAQHKQVQSHHARHGGEGDAIKSYEMLIEKQENMYTSANQLPHRTESAFDTISVSEQVIAGSKELTADRMALEGRKVTVRGLEAQLIAATRSSVLAAATTMTTAQRSEVAVGNPIVADQLHRKLADERAALRVAERAFLLKCSLAGCNASDHYERLDVADRKHRALSVLRGSPTAEIIDPLIPDAVVDDQDRKVDSIQELQSPNQEDKLEARQGRTEIAAATPLTNWNGIQSDTTDESEEDGHDAEHSADREQKPPSTEAAELAQPASTLSTRTHSILQTLRAETAQIMAAAELDPLPTTAATDVSHRLPPADVSLHSHTKSMQQPPPPGSPAASPTTQLRQRRLGLPSATRLGTISPGEEDNEKASALHTGEDYSSSDEDAFQMRTGSRQLSTLSFFGKRDSSTNRPTVQSPSLAASGTPSWRRSLHSRNSPPPSTEQRQLDTAVGHRRNTHELLGQTRMLPLSKLSGNIGTPASYHSQPIGSWAGTSETMTDSDRRVLARQTRVDLLAQAKRAASVHSRSGE